MKSNRDFWAGCLLLGIGVSVAVNAYSSYRIGSIREMGTGYMPFALAVLLSLLGLITIVMSQMGNTEPPSDRKFELQKVLPVGLGVLAFAVGITRVGLIPSIGMLVGIAALADKKLTLKTTGLLIIVLSLISWVVFVLLLKMNLPLWG